jgi:hypothetical protein
MPRELPVTKATLPSRLFTSALPLSGLLSSGLPPFP